MTADIEPDKKRPEIQKARPFNGLRGVSRDTQTAARRPLGQCAAQVWERDTYRRTGRGKSGFEMHYNRRQCRRKPAEGDLCKQHAAMDRALCGNLTRYEFAR